MGDNFEVRLTTYEDLRQKFVLMHQASLREFQREFKFGMENKEWQQKYRICFVGVENQIILSNPHVLYKN